jgi:pyruvate,orthophosphate dikinase
MTFGYSRDDAEARFLLQYVEDGILPKNPFQTLDREGVGMLMKWAVDEGRKTRPNLEVGICGEHGGDPESIEWCHLIGNNYVSCSPFRVPIARLAAAHVAIKHQPAKVEKVAVKKKVVAKKAVVKKAKPAAKEVVKAKSKKK